MYNFRCLLTIIRFSICLFRNIADYYWTQKSSKNNNSKYINSTVMTTLDFSEFPECLIGFLFFSIVLMCIE